MTMKTYLYNIKCTFKHSWKVQKCFKIYAPNFEDNQYTNLMYALSALTKHGKQCYKLCLKNPSLWQQHVFTE